MESRARLVTPTGRSLCTPGKRLSPLPARPAILSQRAAWICDLPYSSEHALRRTNPKQLMIARCDPSQQETLARMMRITVSPWLIDSYSAKTLQIHAIDSDRSK